MTTELFSDNAATTLTSSPTSGATSFTVASSAGFPAAVTGTSQFRVIIGAEIITVTNVAGTTWTCVATSAAHASADVVTHVLTAASLGNFVDGKVATAIPGAWTAYTPTWTNLTVGNGTVDARYTQVGKTFTAKVKIIFGSTTTITGIFYPSMPVTIYSPTEVGTAIGFDTSAVMWAAGGFLVSNYIVINSIRATATAPWTWAVGDILWITITGEAA